MKLPFQTLAVLLFFVGSPIGLMRLTSNAIETTKTYPLMSVAPSAGFAAMDAVEQSITRAIAPNRLAYRAITELVGESTSLNRFRQFVDNGNVDRHAAYSVTAYSVTSSTKQVPGLIVAAERAIASSWVEMQPSFVALPSQLGKLQQRLQLGRFSNRALEYVASRPIPTRSPVPTTSFDGRQIPGLIVAAERAVMASWKELQPAIIALPTSRIRDFEAASKPAIRVARMVENYRSQARLLRGIGSLIRARVDNR